MITSKKKIGILIIFLQLSFISFAQVVPPPKADTIREFEIIRGPSMRSINVDSVTTLQTIAGGAIIKQGTTIFSSDSVAINPATHVVEAFGNVHINQADSVQTYAQYLKYIGTEKTAYLKKDVRLNDKKGTVFTQELDYNLSTGIGNYHNGGKVINGKTTITSKDGTYYHDTKDVYFRNDVVVVGPKNHITTDSLLYNMQSQGSNFTGNTYIKNKEVDIHTTQGTYDFNTGNALFTTRTSVKDSSGKIYIANNMALDDKSGNAQLEGNAIVKDSANGFIVFANQIFLNKKNNSFLATRKPILIIKQKDDSIYVAADTIFSGYTTAVKNENFILKKDSVIQDSSQAKISSDSSKIVDSSKLRPQIMENLPVDSGRLIAHKVDSVRASRVQAQKEKIQKLKETQAQDSAKMPLETEPPLADSNKIKPAPNIVNPIDSVTAKKKDTVNKTAVIIDSGKIAVTKRPKRFNLLKSNRNDSVVTQRPPLDSNRVSMAKTTNPQDTIKGNKNDTTNIIKVVSADSNLNKIPGGKIYIADSLKSVNKDSVNKPDSGIRYFLAFHHVRIFSDSLQSVCDSLFFSAKDSVFRLYYDPVIWSGHSQIAGDTVFLYTKNKKAERLYVFERGMIINRTTQGFFNQIAGKTINGYFNNGAIDYMRVRGSQSESIYYAQNEDSEYVGMNRATGDVIDLYFKNDDLKKVLFVNDIKGKMYPMKQIPEDQKFLKNFLWLDNKRPKNKLELFE
jgi:lipopolysaccharide export system protein LptA